MFWKKFTVKNLDGIKFHCVWFFKIWLSMAQSLARGAHANYSRACQVGLVKCKGPARAFCQPEQKCQVKKLVKWIKIFKKKIFFFGEIDFISIHVFSKLNFLKDSDLLWEETKSVTKIYIFSTPTGSLIWQNIWRIGIGRSKGSGMVGPSKGRSKLWWG